jgi:hypothetical protein
VIELLLGAKLAHRARYDGMVEGGGIVSAYIRAHPRSCSKLVLTSSSKTTYSSIVPITPQRLWMAQARVAPGPSEQLSKSLKLLSHSPIRFCLVKTELVFNVSCGYVA